jgi:hypothetical protein
MPSYLGVPACGLAAFAAVRFARLPWTAVTALALIVGAFAPLFGAALLGGALLAARAGRPRKGPSGPHIVIGVDEHRQPVTIALGGERGSHALIVGATGSGKTVTEALIAARAIEAGRGAVIVDPKGDPLLRDAARAGADRAGREFHEWTPHGSTSYNPYAHGSAAEIADKALAGEQWSEPHYLRQAQRYLAHAARALVALDETPTPARLAELMDPRQLELAARALPDEEHARRLFDYLDSLDGRQRAGLTGTRDRLAILAESELGPLLEPRRGEPALDLLRAIRAREVVYFALEADRLPLLARMLAAAIVGDLVSVAAACQADPVPTLVAIDEFSAIAPEGVARLFGRARAAGFSLLLATQELADLRAARAELLEQVLGNVESVIAHRQSVPDSAELIARIAGTRTSWRSTDQFAGPLPTGRSTRTPVREFAIHPEVIRALPSGCAVVSGARGHAVTHIHHP